jgi:hypothetical protein
MHRRFTILGSLALACAIAACSSNHAATAATSCGLRPSDSVFAAAGPVFRDCAVDKKANLTTTNIRPDPSSYSGGSRPMNGQCFSVELEFVVGEHGAPELGTARVERSNDPRFADAWLKTLATWRYEPAVRAGKPVRQIVDERRTAATQVVIVAKGSPPPTPPRERPPNC